MVLVAKTIQTSLGMITYVCIHLYTNAPVYCKRIKNLDQVGPGVGGGYIIHKIEMRNSSKFSQFLEK